MSTSGFGVPDYRLLKVNDTLRAAKESTLKARGAGAGGKFDYGRTMKLKDMKAAKKLPPRVRRVEGGK